MRLAISLAIFIGGLFFSQSVQAQCVSPLAKPTDRDPKNWTDVRGTVPTAPANGVIRFLPFTGKDAEGPANIDFYYVKFTAPKNIDRAKFFRVIRLSFPLFASGTEHRFAFGEYEASNDVDDPVRANNVKLWESEDPKGALMTFNLDTVAPLSAYLKPALPGSGRVSITVPKVGQYFIEKAGDVQVVCATPHDFVFATVESKLGGMHPVAGFRAFGLAADPGGATWTFFMKAVDRDSGSKMNKLAPGNVFCLGHEFWISFFDQFERFLGRKGLKVMEQSLDNHGPAPYPLQDGTQPPALVCK